MPRFQWSSKILSIHEVQLFVFLFLSLFVAHLQIPIFKQLLSLKITISFVKLAMLSVNLSCFQLA